MIASSSTDRTVDLGSLGPVGRSVAEIRFFHLATVFGLIPWRRARTLRALLTMLYRSTDCLSRAGASVEYLAHSASFHPAEKIAPSNSGTKQLRVGPLSFDIRFERAHEGTAFEVIEGPKEHVARRPMTEGLRRLST